MRTAAGAAWTCSYPRVGTLSASRWMCGATVKTLPSGGTGAPPPLSEISVRVVQRPINSGRGRPVASEMG